MKSYYNLNENKLNLESIPKNEITQSLCNTYIENGGDIRSVPELFITLKLCKKHISQAKPIRYIPRKYITPELIALYIDTMTKKYQIQYTSKTDSKQKLEKIFKNILADKSININNAFYYIPIEFISKSMIDAYLNKQKKKLTKEKQKTYIQEFYINIFNQTKNINLIPKEYLTEVMIEYAKNNLEQLEPNSDIARILKEKENTEKILNQIKFELYNLANTLKTKVRLSKEYNININEINKILDQIKEINKKEYIKIEQLLEENIIIETESLITDIKKISIIKEKMFPSTINPHSKKEGIKMLSSEEKRKLSYILQKLDISPEHLGNIYEAINDDTIQNNSNISLEDIQRVSKLIYIIYVNISKKPSSTNISFFRGKLTSFNFSNLKYLKMFNSKDYFYKNDTPIKHSILNTNGNIIEITEENAKIVIDILNEKNIPLTNAITIEAIRIYFKGGVEELTYFIEKLHSYDLIIQEVIDYANESTEQKHLLKRKTK